MQLNKKTCKTIFQGYVDWLCSVFPMSLIRQIILFRDMFLLLSMLVFKRQDYWWKAFAGFFFTENSNIFLFHNHDMLFD